MGLRFLRPLYGFCAILSLSGLVHAQPELRAELVWRGSCEDAEELRRQVRARGAELTLRNEPRSSEAEASGTLRVEVTVTEASAGTLSADIHLQSDDGEEARRVQASSCGGLQSAVAWVLAVLAQQRAPDRTAPPESEPESLTTAPPTSALPSVSPERVAEPTLSLRARPSEPSRSPRVARRSEPGTSRWGLGCSLIGGLGLLSAPALGPAVFGRYHYGAAWLPTLQLSVQRLVTFGFESNKTSLALTRDAARLDASFSLVDSWLSAGLAVEAGRLAAAGSGAALARGASDAAFWFAFAAPIRFSAPLVGRKLRAELQLELDYAPVPYTFRYGSGDTLTSTSAVEGRGHLGIVSLF